jgi:hypothetical protein
MRRLREAALADDRTASGLMERASEFGSLRGPQRPQGGSDGRRKGLPGRTRRASRKCMFL